MRLPVTVSLMLSVCALTATAQICTGTPSFDRNPIRLLALAAFGKDARAFGVGIGIGGRTLFAHGGVQRSTFDAFDGAAITLSADVGYDWKPDPNHNVRLCPVASISATFGPDQLGGTDNGVRDFTETDLAFGLAIGAVAFRSRRLRVLPAGSLSLAYTKAEIENSGGVAIPLSETFAVLDLGIGFVFNETVTLHPSVAIPLGLKHASPGFGLSLAFHWGPRSG